MGLVEAGLASASAAISGRQLIRHACYSLPMHCIISLCLLANTRCDPLRACEPAPVMHLRRAGT